MSLASVATSTTGFLIVSFEAFGYIIVYDKPHIGLVNTHTESNSGHNHVHLLHEKFILILGSYFIIEASVVG